MPCLRMLRRLVFVLFIIVWAPSNRGQDLLNEISVKAGLVVHLGCGDGQLTASLAGNDHIVVQAIDRDSDKIQLARQTIVEQGAYVSVTYGQQTKPVTSLTKESAVKGGLAVLIGCDEKASVMLLHQNDRFLVQALDQEKQKVAATRDYIHSKGLYGKTTANTYNGVQLPFVDNLVNRRTASETERLVEKAGGQATSIVCDISKEGEVKAMGRKAAEVLGGKIDILHDNALEFFAGLNPLKPRSNREEQ